MLRHLKRAAAGRRRVLAGAGAFVLGAPAIVRAQGQNGVALVIGNSKYQWEASLPNVRRDAPDVAKAFQALGLKTELVQDVGRDAISAAIEKFKSASRGANLAAFYFAGHGASWDKDTYLVPEDADLTNPKAVPGLLSVTAVRDDTKDASHRLLVFDNCRNNPADGWRQRAASFSSQFTAAEQLTGGLNAPNTLVLFSTAPGRIALDGPAGENSPFAAAFLRQLAAASIDLTALAANLRRDLLVATRGRQVLWDQSSYSAPFVLSGARGRAATGAREGAATGIVELPKAYAFARENRLPLPPGLVAFRAPEGSPHEMKVGTFQCTTKLRVTGVVGNVGNTTGSSLEPLLLVVIAISGNETADIVISTKDWAQAGGSNWRYISAGLSGARLKYTQLFQITANLNDWSQSPQTLDEFAWKDANSGVYTGPSQAHSMYYSSRFTRLDG